MLIAVTTRCDMGCSHCMADCTPEGEDISAVDFKYAVDQIATCDPWVIITGGEPLMHPDIIEMLDYALSKGLFVSLTTNGLHMFEPDIYDGLCRLMDTYGTTDKSNVPHFQIQITADKRYYPKPIDIERVKQFCEKYEAAMLVTELASMSLLGRARKNNLKPRVRKAPMCCNVIMVANQVKSFEETVLYLTEARKLCHFTVMPNLDVHMCECRQLKLTNMRTDPDWKKTCHDRLRIESTLDKDKSCLCHKCEFDNKDIYDLVFTMNQAKALINLL